MDAVGNDLCWERPILITGSNASDKSTFIKARALMRLMGFPEKLVARAEADAGRLDSGKI